MNDNYEEYQNNLNEMVEANVEAAQILRKFFRNVIVTCLVILIPSLLHFFMADNILGSIFIVLLMSGVTIVFWVIFFEMNQRLSMATLSAQIEVVAKKHY